MIANNIDSLTFKHHLLSPPVYLVSYQTVKALGYLLSSYWSLRIFLKQHVGVHLIETLLKRFESFIRESYSERFMYGRFGVVSRGDVLCQRS